MKLNEMNEKLPETERDAITYEVSRCTDMTEGRGGSVVVERFTEYVDACEFVEGRPGVMGRVCKWAVGEGGDWEIEPVLVKTKESCEEIRNTNKETVEVSTDDLEALINFKEGSQFYEEARSKIKSILKE